jgi:ankyrin repeat protein
MKQKDFFLACKTGNIQEIENSLKSSFFNRVGVNKRNEEGKTALIMAIIDNNYDICEFLIKKGADVNKKDHKNRNWTALFYASIGKNVKILQLLIDNGARINEAGNLGMTALHWAAKSGSISACKLLIENGANVNARDEVKRTPLSYAYEKVKFWSRGRYQVYPLKDFVDISNLLLDNGAEPD